MSGIADQARKAIEKTEQGHPAGAEEIAQVETVDPAAAQAVEQEAADGPDGLGVSR